MQDKKQSSTIKKYVASVGCKDDEQTNVQRFVQALTNYCTLHKRMVEVTYPASGPRSKKVKPYKA